MKKDKLTNALGMIDDDLIAEYQQRNEKKARRAAALRITALAASFCLIVTSVFTVIQINNHKSPVSVPPTQGEDTTHETEKETEPLGDFKILNITAEKTDGDLISLDTRFIVECENGTVDRVREHVFISGGPEYTVEKTETENCYAVTLSNYLSSASTVQVSYVENSAVEYSWAFQTESALQVSGTYPRSLASDVDKDTVIEIEFSSIITSDLSEYVKTEPQIDGTWEYIGRTARLTPNEALAENETYTITVLKGVKSDGLSLESSYSFSFSISSYDGSNFCSPITVSADKVNTYTDGEDVTVVYRERHLAEDGTVSAVVDKFSTGDDMASYAMGSLNIATEEYGRIEDIKTSAEDYYSFFNIPLDFDCGYYVAHIYNAEGRFIFDWIIQVNNIRAYLGVTNNDIIAWAADENGLLSDARVEYNEKEYKTDNNGIAVLKDVGSNGGYVKIGSKEMPLMAAIENFTNSEYISSFIYTDKTMYKPDETVHVWGAVPTKLFGDKADKSFTVVLGDGEQTVTVTPDKYGAFETEFDLVNHVSRDDLYIRLKYDNTIIGACTIHIQNYHLQNYIFEVKADKNYAYAGDSYDFDVLVTHISGVTVKGKRVQARYYGDTYDSVCDENGYAHFSIQTQKLYHTSDRLEEFYQIMSDSITIYSGDDENNDYCHFYLVNTKCFAMTEKTDEAIYINLKKIATDGKENIKYSYMGEKDFLGEGANSSAEVYILLEKEERKKKEKAYDEYTKKYYYEYDYDSSYTEIDKFTVDIVNGEAVIDTGKYSIPDATENESYTLYCSLYITDPETKTVIMTGNMSLKASYFKPGKHGLLYDNCKYRLNSDFDSEGCGIGKKVGVTLTDRNGNVQTGGTVLRLIYNDGIISHKLLSADSDLSVTTTEEMFPWAYLTGAYYTDGHFYRMPTNDIYSGHEEKKINIDIAEDKTVYSPGDTVTLNITTKDAKGDAISCTTNISVVNEAVFLTYPDNSIFPSRSYGKGKANFYSYSSHRIFEMIPFEGGMGGGNPEESGSATTRDSFDDTACFKTVQTDKNGKATVTFTLPDNVCEYRITTHAVKDGVYTGSARHFVSACMDFFIQSTPPRNVKSSDDLVLNANSILESGIANVEFTFTVKEADFCETLTAMSGANASVNLGKLPVGTYTANISAVCGDYKDAVEYPFEIINSAQQIVKQEEFSPNDTPVITPSALPVTLEIYNTQTQRYLKYFDYLERHFNERLDTIVCNNEAALQKKQILGDDTLSFATDYSTINLYLCSQDHLLSYLPEGEGSPVMTALFNYYIHASGLWSTRYYTPKPGYSRLDYFRYLLYRAACGDSVLVDLRYAKNEIGDNEYCRALMSCAFAFVGDYTNAEEVYKTMTGECDDEDYAALRIIAATFIDKENAAAMIDAVIDDKPYTLYLPFAVLSYIKNNTPDITKTDTVKISCGAFKDTVTVNGIEIKKVKINEKDLSDISFETKSDNIRICAVYQADYTVGQEDGTGDIIASISGDTGKYQIAYLNLDLAYLPVRCGRIRVALPNCFRYIGMGTNQDYVYITANADSLVINVGEKAADKIKIPLIIKNEGNYVIEPVVFTSSEGVFRSDAFEFTAE